MTLVLGLVSCGADSVSYSTCICSLCMHVYMYCMSGYKVLVQSCMYVQVQMAVLEPWLRRWREGTLISCTIKISLALHLQQEWVEERHRVQQESNCQHMRRGNRR